MPIDFSIRDFCYPFSIYRLRQIFERTQWLSSSELATYQNQRLALIIRHACDHVPYYQHLFNELGLSPRDIQTVDDLKKLPVLSKSAVRESGTNLLADNASRYSPHTYTTSGTTGSPLQFYLDKNALILEFVYYWRHWNWAGYRLGDRFAQMGTRFFLEREHHMQSVTFWQPHVRRLMLNSSQLSLSRGKEFAEALRKYWPQFLKGMASGINFLALSIKEAGITDISFRAIFSTGEVLTPQYRAMAESVFHCPVLDSYGNMEGTAAISQCMHGGYHINSDYGFLEFANLKPTANGDTMIGDALGTSLYNLAMPLVRYDMGDSIELFSEPAACPCGRTFPLVKAIHGRSNDIIVTPDGRFITALFTLPELVTGIDFIQFIQESSQKLLVHVVPGKMWTDEQKEKLAFCIERLVGSKMDVSIHPVDRDEIITDVSGKIRPVISQVDWKALA